MNKEMEAGLVKMIEEGKKQRQEDAQKFKELDPDKCMICWAEGEDKRSFTLNCFYAVNEAIPEALNVGEVPELFRNGDYYLRICKACRGAFLSALSAAADKRRELRAEPKDHDGNSEVDDPSRSIPVRINGAIIYMNEQEFNRHRKAKQMRKKND